MLGQVKNSDKSNEIPAIHELLKRLLIAGCIITIDAAGCQGNIAALIKKLQGDYVLAIKGNQGDLHKQVENFFQQAIATNLETREHSHYQKT